MIIFSEVMSQSSAALQLRYLQVIVITVTITITITITINNTNTITFTIVIHHQFHPTTYLSQSFECKVIIPMFSDFEQHQCGEKLNNHISVAH